jgi:hypothetical protein
MPITWGFDRSGVATITLTTPYSFQSWQRAMDGLLDAPRVLPLRLLVDRRDANPLDTGTLARMLAYVRCRSTRLAGTTAAIVVDDEAAIGMFRMLERRTALARVPVKLKVFADYEAAVAWLSSLDFA